MEGEMFYISYKGISYEQLRGLTLNFASTHQAGNSAGTFRGREQAITYSSLLAQSSNKGF